MSHFMVAILIERSEKRLEEYYSDIPVANHVTISWIPAPVLYASCFNGHINSLQYFCNCTNSSLTTELQIEIPFDRRYIVDFWETI